MQTIETGTIQPGTKIFASVVTPGMVIDPGNGKRFDVGQITENYDTFTFTNGGGYDTVTVDYAGMVTLLGYFNLD